MELKDKGKENDKNVKQAKHYGKNQGFLFPYPLTPSLLFNNLDSQEIKQDCEADIVYYS